MSKLTFISEICLSYRKQQQNVHKFFLLFLKQHEEKRRAKFPFVSETGQEIKDDQFAFVS